MVLGTSAHKNGIRATTFRHDLDAGIGYLVGGGPAPQVVRTFYLDMQPPSGSPSARGHCARPPGRSPATPSRMPARARGTC
jgi:S-DNA-T family DNA segregation ATPase FtsK/SpoIIIE